VDKYLKYARYIVLAWVIYVTATTAKLVFSDYDPYHALFNLLSPEVAIPSVVILAVTLVLSLMTERPWCRYACPFGAVLGLFNKIRLFTIRRQPPTCIQCKLCDRKCPVGIKVSEKKKIGDVLCISCLECTSEAVCPKGDTVDLALRFGAAGKEG
jgi:polyferredoxin